MESRTEDAASGNEIQPGRGRLLGSLGFADLDEFDIYDDDPVVPLPSSPTDLEKPTVSEEINDPEEEKFEEPVADELSKAEEESGIVDAIESGAKIKANHDSKRLKSLRSQKAKISDVQNLEVSEVGETGTKTIRITVGKKKPSVVNEKAGHPLAKKSEEPVIDGIEESAAGELKKSAPDKVEVPSAQQIKGPASREAKATDAKEVTEPATEKVTEPATEKVTEPATEKVTEPATEKVTEPATEKVTEPATEKVTEPATEKVTEPATEKVTEPATEKVAELEAEEVTEPEAGEVTEPEAGEVTEPEAGEVTEPEAGEVTEPEAGEVTEPEAGEVTEPEAEKVTEPEAGEVTEPEAGEVTEPEAGEVTELEAGEVTELEAGEVTELEAGEVTEPEAEKVTEPEAEKVTEPEAEKVTEPEAEKVAEPEAEKVTEPEAEEVAEPEAEKVTEPEAEEVAEPEAEEVAEPATEKVAEPAAEELAEPAAENDDAPAANKVDAPAANKVEAPAATEAEQSTAEKAAAATSAKEVEELIAGKGAEPAAAGKIKEQATLVFESPATDDLDELVAGKIREPAKEEAPVATENEVNIKQNAASSPMQNQVENIFDEALEAPLAEVFETSVVSGFETSDDENVDASFESEAEAPSIQEDDDPMDLCCPSCDGVLSLQRSHIGVEGACVYCSTLIVAHEFSSGEVAIIRVSDLNEDNFKDQPSIARDDAPSDSISDKNPVPLEEQPDIPDRPERIVEEPVSTLEEVSALQDVTTLEIPEDQQENLLTEDQANSLFDSTDEGLTSPAEIAAEPVSIDSVFANSPEVELPEDKTTEPPPLLDGEVTIGINSLFQDDGSSSLSNPANVQVRETDKDSDFEDKTEFNLSEDESTLLDLNCPSCDAELVLDYSQVGIQGACVECDTPIIAHRFDNGEVAIIRVENQEIGTDEEIAIETECELITGEQEISSGEDIFFSLSENLNQTGHPEENEEEFVFDITGEETVVVESSLPPPETSNPFDNHHFPESDVVADDPWGKPKNNNSPFERIATQEKPMAPPWESEDAPFANALESPHLFHSSKSEPNEPSPLFDRPVEQMFADLPEQNSPFEPLEKPESEPFPPADPESSPFKTENESGETPAALESPFADLGNSRSEPVLPWENPAPVEDTKEELQPDISSTASEEAPPPWLETEEEPENDTKEDNFFGEIQPPWSAEEDHSDTEIEEPAVENLPWNDTEPDSAIEPQSSFDSMPGPPLVSSFGIKEDTTPDPGNDSKDDNLFGDIQSPWSAEEDSSDAEIEEPAVENLPWNDNDPDSIIESPSPFDSMPEQPPVSSFGIEEEDPAPEIEMISDPFQLKDTAPSPPSATPPPLPNTERRNVPLQSSHSISNNTSGTKRLSNTVIILMLVAIGTASGALIAAFLVPVDDYVGKAKVYLAGKAQKENSGKK